MLPLRRYLKNNLIMGPQYSEDLFVLLPKFYSRPISQCSCLGRQKKIGYRKKYEIWRNYSILAWEVKRLAQGLWLRVQGGTW